MPKKKANPVVNPVYKKTIIPKALKEQVWIKYVGKQFEVKCLIDWCENKINVFDFHTGHNIPESKGGKTDINNLRPICSRCNQSMGNQYTITEWCQMGTTQPKNIVPEAPPPNKWFCCC